MFVFLVFYFQKSHSTCRKKRIFEKQAKNNQTKTLFYKLKTGPIMLRNILGPVFNLYLDQFITYKMCYFCFLFFGAETPIFIVFSANNAKFKETQKRKKTRFVNTIVLTAFVKMSVLFVFCIFHFCCFFNFQFFECF